MNRALVIRAAIERTKGTPRLMVNAKAAGVEVPEHIREQHGEGLLIDLKPTDPLDLVLDDRGVHATLSFAPTIARCVFPWTSIFGVEDLATGVVVLLGVRTHAGIAIGITVEEPTPPIDRKLKLVR